MATLVKEKKSGKLYAFSADGAKTRIYGNSIMGYYLENGNDVHVANPEQPFVVDDITKVKLSSSPSRKQQSTKLQSTKRKLVPKTNNKTTLSRTVNYNPNIIVKGDDGKYYSNDEKLSYLLSNTYVDAALKKGAKIIDLSDYNVNLVNGQWVKTTAQKSTSAKSTTSKSTRKSTKKTTKAKLVPKEKSTFRTIPVDTPELYPESGEYTVSRGDTLWGISRRYNIPFEDIVSMNPLIENTNRIYVGDKVRIAPLKFEPKFPRPIQEVSLNTSVGVLPPVAIKQLSEADLYAVDNYGIERWNSLSDKKKEKFRQQYNTNIKPNLL